MQTICFLATCQSQHILCTHCWVELSLMLSTLLYFIIVILILLVINRCLINCSHYLIYFAIVNSFLYVLFVGIPTCSKPVTSPPRFLHGDACVSPVTVCCEPIFARIRTMIIFQCCNRFIDFNGLSYDGCANRPHFFTTGTPFGGLGGPWEAPSGPKMPNMGLAGYSHPRRPQIGGDACI